jgi:hypothetical protein
MTSLRLLLLAALAFGWTACTSHRPIRDGARAGPFFEPTNITSSDALPAHVRRVLLLPLAADGATISEENLDRLGGVILTELNRTGRFETVTLSRDHLARLTGTRQLPSTAQMPSGFLDRLFNIYNEYAADAILLVDITSYTPYPPLTLGIRAKLAHIRDSDILWAADLLFSAADPSVANSARRYALTLGTSPHLDHSILQNPTRFAGYAASATFQTLPPRAVAASQKP